MQKRKKIVVIGLKGLPARGGAATVGQVIISELQDKYDFTVLSVSSHTSASTGYWEQARQIVYKAVGHGGFNTLWYYLRCLAHVMFRRYDLVFLHHAESGFLTPILKLKYKVVVTFHGVFLLRDPKYSLIHNLFFRFSERMNVKLADDVVSVAEEDLKYIESRYGKRITFIPNGIKIRDRKVEPWPKRPPYILFAAGRIYQIKGLHLLLSALHEAKIDLPLVAAGRLEVMPGYKQEIETLVKGLNVEFTGLITENSRLLGLVSAAEIFIFPSLTEAMSIMLLEAVSTGVPVIASDIPSNRAIFGDNELLFFRSGDHLDLGEKIRFALENKPLMRQRAQKAAERLARYYTSERVAEQYDQLFKRLL